MTSRAASGRSVVLVILSLELYSELSQTWLETVFLSVLTIQCDNDCGSVNNSTTAACRKVGTFLPHLNLSAWQISPYFPFH